MIDLKEVLNGSEKVNLEVKIAQSGLPNSIWETYSSFANTFGGTIILGIGEDQATKKLIPYGVSEPKKIVSDIWNVLNNRLKISSNILLEHQVYILHYEGLEYVVIEVPKADRHDKPVYVGSDMFSGSFKRNYEGDYHCSKEEVKAMLRDQSDTSADFLVLENVGLDALNDESVKNYRLRFNNLRKNHVWTNIPTEDFLVKIGAARISEMDGKVHPTLGGLIFFGNFVNIMYELPSFFLDYRARLSNENRWSDRVCSGDSDWSGNVFDFYFRIIDRLTADVRRPFMLDENLVRVDDTSVHKALRECLANSLIHADYYGRRGVVIDKTFNRITISNPGTFRVDIDAAISGGLSDARNSAIFNMFSLINVGERSGTGLCDVYNTWNLNGYKKPEFVETVNPDRITLTLYFENEGNQASNEGNQASNEGNEASNEGNQNLDLRPLEEKIYSLIKQDNSLSLKLIAEKLDVSHSTIERATRKLKDLGYISRAGKTKGFWIIRK